MNATYTIKNFRVFDEQGATFEMAPITILTGCNSSGKSTVTKSLMLLNEIFKNILKDYVAGTRCYLEDYTLNFTKGIHNLGKFTSVINKKSAQKEIHFEYSGNTFFYDGRITAQLTFVCDENTGTQNGKFSKIVILNQAGESICNMDFESGIAECNIAMLKEQFFSFAHEAFLYKKYRGLIDKAQLGPLTAKEQNEAKHIEEELGNRLVYLRHFVPQIYNRDHLQELIDPESLLYVENYAKYKSLFYIDALNWLDGYKKVDVRRIIENHVKRSYIINNIRYSELKNTITEKIKRIVDEFYNSDFQSFQEFYLHYENLFLKTVQAQFMSENSDEKDSFLQKIVQSLAYKNVGYNSAVHFIKDAIPTYANDVEEFWDHPEYRFIYIVHYMRMIMPVEDLIKYKKTDIVDNEWYDAPIFDSMVLFLSNLLEDILVDSPDFINAIDFVDANRANVNRIYNFHEQSSFNLAIQEYLSHTSEPILKKQFPQFNLYIPETQEVKFIEGTDGHIIPETPVSFGIQKYNIEEVYDYSERYIPGTFSREWLKKFDIADDFDIKLHAEGVGVSIVLSKNGEERNLADYGFGVTQLFSILMQIENNILNHQKELRKDQIESNDLKKDMKTIDEAQTAINNYQTYYKVIYTFTDSYLAIEEPESHLHPMYQSLLTDMFLDAYTKYRISFIIETHSEYLVRRSQVLVAGKYEDEQELAKKCPFKVYYLPKPEDGKPYDMEYQTNGAFGQSFGKGFYDEASMLSFQVLTANNK